MKLSLSIVILLMVGSVHAGTLTVCPSGCGYSSIQAAVDAAMPDDVIEIHSGTYYETLNISKAVTLLGKDVGSGMPVIDAQNQGPAIKLSSNDFCIAGIYFENSLFSDIYAIIADDISLVRPKPKTESTNEWDFVMPLNRTMPGITPPGFMVFGNEYCGEGVCITTDWGLFVDEVLDNPTDRRHLGILMHSGMEDGGSVTIYMGNSSVFESDTGEDRPTDTSSSETVTNVGVGKK